MGDTRKHILILGAGINGCALGRELVLNGVDVTLVDTADIASGATAYSSRLIHGGLRYLEYRELDLVRESLGERERLLRLAPQFVRPFRLFVPTSRRLGGLGTVLGRVLGVNRLSMATRPDVPRGMWLVRLGLWLYDTYAGRTRLPRHSIHPVGASPAPAVDPTRYRWLCSFYDAQVEFPERLVLSMIEDTWRAAAEQNVRFDVFTYHHAVLDKETVTIHDVRKEGPPVTAFEPAAIINATGAWIDDTLRELHVDSKRLIGGTKGSHFLTFHDGLRSDLHGDGIYAEAADGRPVFLLPFGEGTLVGTTDVPFDGSPANAVAERAELDYLLQAVNDVMADNDLGPEDVAMHYSGVRPLPHVGPKTPAAITRRHHLEENRSCRVPLYSVIGGKLTTARALAEETAGVVLGRLGQTPRLSTRERMLPGGESFPGSVELEDEECVRISQDLGFQLDEVRAIWKLYGSRTASILSKLTDQSHENLDGTVLPRSFARWVIDNECVRRLGDLVERRLMLLYHRRLSTECLRQLTEMLVDSGHVSASDAAAEVEGCIDRLRDHFGRTIE